MKKIVIVSSIIFLLFLALVTFSFLKISDKNIFPKKIVERKINQFDEFTKLKEENIEKLEIISYTEDGMSSDVITNYDSIRKFYNYVNNIRVGNESKTTCEDNTTIYKFYLIKDEAVSIEIECNNLVINTKRYEIIK